MSDEHEPARAFLFNLREDGSPTCHPMSGLQKDGAPAFNTYRKSAKAQNLLRDPRAAVALLKDWKASPSSARFFQGLAEQTAPPETPVSGSGAGASAGVKQRVQDRVAEGKRIYFVLKER